MADRQGDSGRAPPLPMHWVVHRPRRAFGEGFPEVLAAAQAGADWAFAVLYDGFAPKVAGYLRVQGARDVDDLTSEVFLAGFRAIGSFAGDEAQLRSWIFTIAHRRLTDERRRLGRRPVADTPPPDIASGVDVAHDAIASLGEDRVRALCARLGDDQRDVMLLRLVGGFTVTEVAAMLGRSEGAVKALQRRAVEGLRRIISHEGAPL